MKLNFNTIMAAAIATATFTASAGENLWVYAKGTDTRPAGSYEFKIADTIRLDKNAGDHYTFHDIRPEIEYLSLIHISEPTRPY